MNTSNRNWFVALLLGLLALPLLAGAAETAVEAVRNTAPAGGIETWLLVLTLFLPRLGLFIAWCSGQIPANNIPFIGDCLLAVFLPRLLMIIYIVGIYGFGGWFWAHAIAWLLSAITIRATTSSSSKSK